MTIVTAQSDRPKVKKMSIDIYNFFFVFIYGRSDGCRRQSVLDLICVLKTYFRRSIESRSIRRHLIDFSVSDIGSATFDRLGTIGSILINAVCLKKNVYPLNEMIKSASSQCKAMDRVIIFYFNDGLV